MSLSTAWEVEALKLRRSSVARTAGSVLVVGVAAMSATFTAVGLAGGDSQLAAKVQPMLVGTGWTAYLGLLGQVISVAMMLCAGIVLAWSVGREFADGTIGCLLSLPTSPRSVLVAKLGTVLLAAVGAGISTVVVAVPLGLLIGLGPPGPAAWAAAAKALTIAVLTVLLTVPLALVASVRRGYLPGIGALLGVVVATQIATIAGVGGWFPWAAPGLWAGMGGPAMAASVSPWQLLLAVPVAVAGGAASAWWWNTAELR